MNKTKSIILPLYSYKQLYEMSSSTHTCVTIQLWVNDVDFAVFLCFFCRFRRPRAGHQVVGTPVLFQADQIERNCAELPGPAALQKQDLVVVGDISVETDVPALNTSRRVREESSYRSAKSHVQQLPQETFCLVEDLVEV